MKQTLLSVEKSLSGKPATAWSASEQRISNGSKNTSPTNANITANLRSRIGWSESRRLNPLAEMAEAEQREGPSTGLNGITAFAYPA